MDNRKRHNDASKTTAAGYADMDNRKRHNDASKTTAWIGRVEFCLARVVASRSYIGNNLGEMDENSTNCCGSSRRIGTLVSLWK
jgi:hypothetical protein